MTFVPVPGSRKAEPPYLDLSTDSVTFKLTYPGSTKAKVPKRFLDPNYPADELIAGGLSGLWYEAGLDRYFTVSDVGPQAQDIPEGQGFAFEGEKVFNDPDFLLQVYELQQGKKGKVRVRGEVTLNVPDGQGGFRPATGIGQMYRIDESTGEVSGLDSAAFTPDGDGGYEPVPADAFGMDPEAVLRLSIEGLNNGNPVFAISDEYRPQVSIHDAETGNLIHRIVPKGSRYKGYGHEEGRGEVREFTKKTLPKVYLERRSSRGFEALAYNSNNGLLYAFIQTPMDVNGERKGSTVRRIIAMDPITGEAKHEYIYRQSGPINQDKIGDAVYDAERDVFYVIDRDNVADETANKAVIQMDLKRATDVLGFNWESILGEGVYAPEMLNTPEEVGEALSSPLMNGIISEVHQTTLFNLAQQGINTLFDKPEGLALKPDGTLVFGFDNDFQRVSGRPDNMLAFVTDRFGNPEAKTTEFILNYPGTNSPELPEALEDPNHPDVQIIAGGLSGLTYDTGLNRYFTISDVGPQALDIPEGQGFAFEGEKIFSDPDFKLQVTELKYKIKSGKVQVKDTTTLKVPDGEGGFRDATGIAQMYTINQANGEISGLDSSNAAFTPDGTGGEQQLNLGDFNLFLNSLINVERENGNAVLLSTASPNNPAGFFAFDLNLDLSAGTLDPSTLVFSNPLTELYISPELAGYLGDDSLAGAVAGYARSDLQMIPTSATSLQVSGSHPNSVTSVFLDPAVVEQLGEGLEITGTVDPIAGADPAVDVSGLVGLGFPLAENAQLNFDVSTGIPQFVPGGNLFSHSGSINTQQTFNAPGGYVPVAPDAFGLDPESIQRISVDGLNNGNPVFAVSDEYRPQVALFDAESGELIHRIVPEGSDYSAHSYEPGRGDVPEFTKATLPEVYLERRGSRGFEALAYNSDDGLLYAFIQTPMDVNGERNGSTVRRILAMDPITGEPQHEYMFRQIGPSNQDKIGDAVYDPDRGAFLVIDRDNGDTVAANKSILRMDLSDATDTLGYDWEGLLGDGVYAPELLDSPAAVAEAFAEGNIMEVDQVELLNLPSLPGVDPRFDKPEGLALKSDGTLVVGFDNDFQRVDGRPDNLLTAISF